MPVHSLKGANLFWWENLQSSIVWVILAAVACLFLREVGSNYAFFQRYNNYFYRIIEAIHSFNGTAYFPDVKICIYPGFPTQFLSRYFRTPVTVKQTSYRTSYIFRVTSIILKWEKLLEAASSFAKRFLQNTYLPGAATSFWKLLLGNKYFSGRLLLENKYFFRTSTALVELFLQNK